MVGCVRISEIEPDDEITSVQTFWLIHWSMCLANPCLMIPALDSMHEQSSFNNLTAESNKAWPTMNARPQAAISVCYS